MDLPILGTEWMRGVTLIESCNYMKLKKNSDVKNLIFYIILALASMNFMHEGSMLILCLCTFVCVQLGFCLKINKWGMITIFMTCAMFPIAFYFYSITDAIKCLNYALCYVVGYNAYINAKEGSLVVHRTIQSVFIGSLLYVLLLIINNPGEPGYQRVLVDVWTGEYISVTIVAVVTSFVIGYGLYLLFYDKTVKAKIIAASALFLVVYINYMTSTRTAYVLLAIMLCAMCFLKYLELNPVQKIKFLSKIVLVGIVVVVLYRMDYRSIRTNIESSLLWERFFVDANSASRIDILISHLKYSDDYLFGGGLIAEKVGITAHNVIQDFYDNYGLFPTIFFIGIQCREWWRLHLLSKVKDKTSKLLLVIYLTMLIQLLTEPVVTGYPIYIWNLFIIDGLTSAYLKEVYGDNRKLHFETGINVT